MHLLTLSEAAALCERKHGKAVYPKTIKRWAERGWFTLHYSNGWKCSQEEFLAWAARSGKLKRQGAAS